jgi:Carbon-nitrogen hydrolase
MPCVSAAVVQAGGILYDAAACIAKAERLLAEAHGAQLIVFPEAFVGGYPKGQDFGARVGSRMPEGRKQFRRYYEGAIDVPGPACPKFDPPFSPFDPISASPIRPKRAPVRQNGGWLEGGDHAAAVPRDNPD